MAMILTNHHVDLLGTPAKNVLRRYFQPIGKLKNQVDTGGKALLDFIPNNVLFGCDQARKPPALKRSAGWWLMQNDYKLFGYSVD